MAQLQLGCLLYVNALTNNQMKGRGVMKTMERTCVMNSRKALMLIAAVLVVTQAAAASPTPIFSSGPVSTTIVSGPRIINSIVNAYVWNIADYQVVNPFFNLITTTGNYVFEYIVHNQSTSTVSISMFQVPIAGPGFINEITTVGTIGGIGAAALIVDPATLPSATFLFISPALAPGMTSSKLVFTSNHGVNISGNAIIGGGSLSGDLVMPTPIPEPVSVMLFGFGGLALAAMRKRISN